MPAGEPQQNAITHDDLDHTGRLASLKAVSRAEIVAHLMEAPRLASDRWRDPPEGNRASRSVGAFAARLQGPWPHHPVSVSHKVADGQAVSDDWIAVHTPGHTPGHTSYFNPTLRVLIV